MFVIAVLLFIASPIFLYLNRVGAIIAGLLLVGYTFANRKQLRTSLDVPALILLALVGVNAAVSLAVGHAWRSVLNELVPFVEICIACELTSRLKISRTQWTRYATWLMAMILLRAVWALVIVRTGAAVIPPIMSKNDELPWVSVSGMTFLRPFDPLMGLFCVLSFACFLYGIRRPLALVTCITTGMVAFLSLTRAEYICVAVGCLLVLGIAGPSTRRCFALVGVGLAALAGASIVMSPAVLAVAQERAVAFTETQFHYASYYNRFVEYRQASGYLSRHPLVGNGLGANKRIWVSDGKELQDFGIHNVFLNLFVNLGFLGMAALSFAAWRALKLGIALVKVSNEPEAKLAASWALASLVFWGIFLTMHPVYSAYHVPALIGGFFGMSIAMQGALERSGDVWIRPVPALVHANAASEFDPAVAEAHAVGEPN